MKTFTLKEYQQEAVEELLRDSSRLLRHGGQKTLVFEAPTGSGKTIMMAEFLAQLTAGDVRFSRANKHLAFIWVAPNKLHAQSYGKLRDYYSNTRALSCAYFTELDDNQINAKQVLFLNWASINKRDNLYIRENERDHNLQHILQNTRYAGRAIVLVIDESHSNMEADKARGLLKLFDADLTIQVSATPTIKPDKQVSVQLADVREEGMVKSLVVINDCYPGSQVNYEGKVESTFSEHPNLYILQAGLKRREKLQTAFAEEGARVNPLLCIQLPSGKVGVQKTARAEVEVLLAENGITYENGKLAVYLANEKKNMDGIEENENTTEVMLFKQGIALGWDCPRAHILVLFREWHDGVFSVQTLGRIMRMPEPLVGHYKTTQLNRAFVYTNQYPLDIKPELAGGYVHIHKSTRQNYESIALLSVHRLRQREKTRLSPLFVQKFLEVANEYELGKKIKREGQTAEMVVLGKIEVTEIDNLREPFRVGKEFGVDNPEYVQALFDHFAQEQLAPQFTVQERSISQVQKAIYAFLNFPLTPETDLIQAAHIALSKHNKEHFVNVLNMAKDNYKESVGARDEPLQENKKWEVAEEITYNEKYRVRAAGKSLMQPFYFSPQESKPEKEFTALLEKTASVCWWYKNGEQESMYFAVSYSEGGAQNPFFVDFIVQFTNGTVGLYDTKSGLIAASSGNKSDGLLAYIKKHSTVKRKLVGGIVSPADAQNYNKGWRIYAGKGRDIKHNDLSNWDALDLTNP